MMVKDLLQAGLGVQQAAPGGSKNASATLGLARHLKAKKVWRAFLESFGMRLWKKFCIG
jgi:hypothetical protein